MWTSEDIWWIEQMDSLLTSIFGVDFPNYVYEKSKSPFESVRNGSCVVKEEDVPSYKYAHNKWEEEYQQRLNEYKSTSPQSPASQPIPSPSMPPQSPASQPIPSPSMPPQSPASQPIPSPSMPPQSPASQPIPSPSMPLQSPSSQPIPSPSMPPQSAASQPIPSPSMSPQSPAGQPIPSPSMPPQSPASQPIPSPSMPPQSPASQPIPSPSMSPHSLASQPIPSPSMPPQSPSSQPIPSPSMPPQSPSSQPIPSPSMPLQSAASQPILSPLVASNTKLSSADPLQLLCSSNPGLTCGQLASLNIQPLAYIKDHDIKVVKKTQCNNLKDPFSLICCLSKAVVDKAQSMLRAHVNNGGIIGDDNHSFVSLGTFGTFTGEALEVLKSFCFAAEIKQKVKEELAWLSGEDMGIKETLLSLRPQEEFLDIDGFLMDAKDFSNLACERYVDGYTIDMSCMLFLKKSKHASSTNISS